MVITGNLFKFVHLRTYPFPSTDIEWWPTKWAVRILLECFLALCGILLKLLFLPGGNPNQPKSDSWAPIHVAASRGHLGVVKVLIENNVFVDTQTKDWSTPLYLAVQGNHQDIVQFLLDKMANPKGVSKVRMGSDPCGGGKRECHSG